MECVFLKREFLYIIIYIYIYNYIYRQRTHLLHTRTEKRRKLRYMKSDADTVR